MSRALSYVDSSDGVAVAVHDLGGPDGAPVLLLAHANGFNAGVWRPFAQALRRDHRVVTLDLRAHGVARTPDDLVWDWSGFGDDVTAVIDAGVLPPGRLHGVGHSLGGAAVTLAAARRPGAVQSLWLYEPVVVPPGALSGPNPLADSAVRRRVSFASLDEAAEHYGSKPPLDVLHPEALRGYVEGGFETQPDGSVVLRCRPAWESAIFRAAVASPAWDAVPALDLPVTGAVGDVDTSPPAVFADALVERLPRGRLERHPGLGHFGPLQEPGRVAADVARWVGGS
jgi:pimeloyl-ACP methyl ester carboxylesterase